MPSDGLLLRPSSGELTVQIEGPLGTMRPSERTSGPLKAQLSTGPAPFALEVSDAGGGSYRVATAVQVSGEYRITFTLNGLPVAGSPITLIAPRATGRRLLLPS